MLHKINRNNTSLNHIPIDPLSEPPLMEEPPVMQDDGYQNNQYDQYEQYDQPMGGNSVPPGHPDYDYAPPLKILG